MHQIQPEEIELEKSVRRLMEKFHAKVITVEKATVLMRRFANNHDLVARHIILCKDQLGDKLTVYQNAAFGLNVVERIRNEEQQQQQQQQQHPQAPPQNPRNNIDQDLGAQEIIDGMRRLPLTQRNLRMFDDANRNLIPSVDKLFACPICDHIWWRRVPQRKQVSRCRTCKRKYDPVPSDQMWGAAEFNCLGCHRVFRGYGQMEVPSPCYMCGTRVTPSRILPPRRSNGPRNRNPHSCCAEDCHNRREPFMPGTHCVHPRSRLRNGLKKVVSPSPDHDSTGSTVATCLSQGSLMECGVDEIIMEDLQEVADEEEAEDNEGREDSDN
nr:PREDICTED: UPF0515 protein C19orf66 homolog [Latimeria chalumnae]|eukprot:XP_014341480.1 PREDICTED: UPF0515 protein C19orf66 homolog [Latimeria chalumnae]